MLVWSAVAGLGAGNVPVVLHEATISRGLRHHEKLVQYMLHMNVSLEIGNYLSEFNCSFSNYEILC